MKKHHHQDVFKLYSEGFNPTEVADMLGLSLFYVESKFNLWNGAKRHDALKKKRVIYEVVPTEEFRTELQKISEKHENKVEFALITKSNKVLLAYERMLNNRNTDIPM
jgi:hypothetical protein